MTSEERQVWIDMLSEKREQEKREAEASKNAGSQVHGPGSGPPS